MSKKLSEFVSVITGSSDVRHQLCRRKPKCSHLIFFQSLFSDRPPEMTQNQCAIIAQVLHRSSPEFEDTKKRVAELYAHDQHILVVSLITHVFIVNKRIKIPYGRFSSRTVATGSCPLARGAPHHHLARINTTLPNL